MLSAFASTMFNLLTKKLMASSSGRGVTPALDNFQIQFYASLFCVGFIFPIWILTNFNVITVSDPAFSSAVIVQSPTTGFVTTNGLTIPTTEFMLAGEYVPAIPIPITMLELTSTSPTVVASVTKAAVPRFDVAGRGIHGGSLASSVSTAEKIFWLWLTGTPYYSA